MKYYAFARVDAWPAAPIYEGMTLLAPQDLVRITAAAERAATRSATLSIQLTPHQLHALMQRVEADLQDGAGQNGLTGDGLERSALQAAPLDTCSEDARDHVIRDVILYRTLRRAAAGQFLRVA